MIGAWAGDDAVTSRSANTIRRCLAVYRGVHVVSVSMASPGRSVEITSDWLGLTTSLPVTA